MGGGVSSKARWILAIIVFISAGSCAVSLWSLASTARHSAYCQRVESASKFVYGETSIQPGTSAALKYLKHASGVPQVTMSQLRTHENSLTRYAWSQTLWVIQENEFARVNLFGAGC